MRGAVCAAGAMLFVARAVGAQVVQGHVVVQGTDTPVEAGVVVLLDERGNEVVQAPLAGGYFDLRAPAAGRYRLRLSAVGYRTTITPWFDVLAGRTLGLSLQVRPQAAIVLDTVEVAGEPVPVRLADFYRRRGAGGGSFITRAEFEQYFPTRFTDVLRRMTGLTVVPNPDFGVNGDTREYLIVSTRTGLALTQAKRCDPLVFVDGAFAGTTATLNLDDYLNVEWVEGIETYVGASTPLEFSRPGAECGVVSVWSREPSVHAGSADRHLELGVRLGARVVDGRLQEGRVGGQVSLTFIGPLDLHAGVHVVPEATAYGITTTRPGWQAFVSLRGRPLGSASPWYLGTGVSVLHVWGEAGDAAGIATRKEISQHLVLAGAAFELGSVRPMVELDLLDPFRRGARQLAVFTAIAVRLY